MKERETEIQKYLHKVVHLVYLLSESPSADTGWAFTACNNHAIVEKNEPPRNNEPANEAGRLSRQGRGISKFSKDWTAWLKLGGSGAMRAWRALRAAG